MLSRLLLLLLCTGVSLAQAAPVLPSERLQALATQAHWLNLGHYQRTLAGRWRSHVDDPRFFLAPRGAEDPLAELQATLKALYQPATSGDQHAQCRYPSRTRWLRVQLMLDDLPDVDCAEYRRWLADIDPERSVLVFPAAYLNSPSSMFGHTLLRIDPTGVEASGTALLSYALNFGATTDAQDNSLMYAWKGLVGGYPGQFALLPYREKIGEYSRLENRDLWEYHLDLSVEETRHLVEHVWELRDIRFDYYFFDENCSYRLLELLEVARPGLELTDDFPLTAIPADTVRAIQAAGLIVRTDYRPSRERELQVRSTDLSADEQRWVLRLAADEASLQEAQWQALPAERRALIQESAYRLLRYRAAGQERDPANAGRSYRLLQAINKNPPPPLALERPTPAEQGHESRTLQLSAGSHEGRPFADYGLRMAYHDLADHLPGFPSGAQIELGHLRLRQYARGHWQLQQLDLVDIRSLTPRTRLLQPWSWQVSAGLERIAGDDDRQTLVSQLGGGAGATWPLGARLQGFALGTVRLEHNPDHASVLSPAIGLNAGLLWRTDLGNLLLEGRHEQFSNGEQRRQLQLTQQIDLDARQAIRLNAHYQHSHRHGATLEAALELRWYLY